MVYFVIALIIGIVINEFLTASAMVPFIALLLLVIFIIIRKWNYSFLLIILLMIVLEFSISSYKNENFYNSLDEIETLSLAIKIVNGSNLLLFIDKMTYTDFEMLINDREVLKSDVLKMTYPKQIANNFSQFLQAINAKMTIITGARGSKSNPTQEELIRIFDSELFFTDSIGAIWLFSDGNNKFKVQEWK